MSLTESTILLCFHPVRMGLFVFGHVVITLFAFRTCQCDFCTHNFHLHVIFCLFGLFFIFEHKKRPIASIRPSTISQIFPSVNVFPQYSADSRPFLPSMANTDIQQIYLFDSCFQQNSGAGFRCTAGGINIIYQDYSFYSIRDIFFFHFKGF